MSRCAGCTAGPCEVWIVVLSMITSVRSGGHGVGQDEAAVLQVPKLLDGGWVPLSNAEPCSTAGAMLLNQSTHCPLALLQQHSFEHAVAWRDVEGYVNAGGRGR